MNAETEAAIKRLADRLEWVAQDVAERVRWLSLHHEREWKTAAAWRTQWAAELDALIVEVELLKTSVQALEYHAMGQIDESQESQHERIYRKVNTLTATFADVLFELLPPERLPIKERFTKALGDLLAEVLGGSTAMAAGVVVVLEKRVAKLEEKQVGGSGD